MTDAVPTAAPDPEAEALMAALPRMRLTRLYGWAFIAAIAAVAGGLALALFLSEAGEGRQFGAITLVFGIVGVVSVATWVRRSHEREVMPVLATAFGLDHVKTDPGYVKALPANFIPLGGKRSCDDLMSGEFAGRRFRFAEVKTETGGKNSRTLFDGVVVELDHDGRLPPFTLVDRGQTEGFLFFKGHVDVAGMTLVHETDAHGVSYGLWTPGDLPQDLAARLGRFADALIALGPALGGDARLHGAVCEGGRIVAALRHKREMFTIGGLLSSEATVMADIRRASAEFEVPMRLVTGIAKALEGLSPSLPVPRPA